MFAAAFLLATLPQGASPLDVAPMPRAVCAPGDLDCRAKSALALAAVAVKAGKTLPAVMPSKENLAAMNALKAAEKSIKAGKKD